ncbi:hypothetical protein ACEWY4_005698 [Coilia grayii]|uniref:Glutamate-rich protein 1 n=1 Tax=Coilia grayii TaxID=363190 RepID=A0ABD1KJF9_9TELE
MHVAYFYLFYVVFRAKVLQKLYPVPQLKPEETIHPPATEVESDGSKTRVARNGTKPVKCNGDEGTPALAGRKLYTVLPPPDGYRADAVVDPTPETTSKGSDPESVEEDDAQKEGPRRKRRRRGKTKVSADGSEGKEGDVMGVMGLEVDPAQTSPAERLSRNKKRKLKKKRRKEKLRSLGLAPLAAAVEFTYQHTSSAEEDEDKTEDEDHISKDEQADEVLEFLNTTLETYISDRSGPERAPPSGTDALLRSLSNRTAPPGELACLCTLKELVLRRNANELRRALEEFRSSTAMPPEEASAVCTLLSYWITDILPLHKVPKT